MTVKELIEQLSELNPEQDIYLGEDNLDEETYYYKPLGVIEKEVEGERISIVYYRS